MENASKALIIAGAILLAILIIGLGVFIYNQASNSISDTGMDQVAARQFNGQFEPYINKTIDSTNAKALIDTVNSASSAGTAKIALSGVTTKDKIQIGHKYIIEPSYTNGLITGISINDANGSSLPGDDGGILIEEDISSQDFNRQFLGYVNGIEGNQSSMHLTYVGATWVIDCVNNSNELYDNHQITLQIPKFFDEDPYDFYMATVESYDNGYISIISINGYTNESESER